MRSVVLASSLALSCCVHTKPSLGTDSEFPIGQRLAQEQDLFVNEGTVISALPQIEVFMAVQAAPREDSHTSKAVFR